MLNKLSSLHRDGNKFTRLNTHVSGWDYLDKDKAQHVLETWSAAVGMS